MIRFQAGHLLSNPRMVSSVLKIYSLPDAGAAHCIPQGVRSWQPCFQSLQVCRDVNGGGVVLTCTPVQGEPMLFVLGQAEIAHLLQLLADGGAR